MKAFPIILCALSVEQIICFFATGYYPCWLLGCAYWLLALFVYMLGNQPPTRSA